MSSILDIYPKQKSPGEERRNHVRSKTFRRGQLKTARGESGCRVMDISPSGVKVRLAAPLETAKQEEVTLFIDGVGEFPGIVAWRQNNDVGVRTNKDAARARHKDNTLSGDRAAAGPRDMRKTTSINELRARRELGSTSPDAGPASFTEHSAFLPAVTVTSSSSLQGPISREDRERGEAAVAIIHSEILTQIRPEIAARMPRPDFEQQITSLVSEVAAVRKLALSAKDQAFVSRRIIAEMVGSGPLEPLLADDTISDILVNGPRCVYVERNGKLQLTDITFTDDQHVLSVATRMVTRAGRRVDESSPIVDARLPDGSRLNIILPPLATRGPTMSIRKFTKKDMTLDHMAEQECLSPAMALLLKIAARCRLNVLISGGTGAGKTTLLNAVSQMIDPNERVITIEDTAELQLQLPHVASLETRPANLEYKGEITVRDLVKNALRMRPDRIILGEVRGAEAFDMLQAMNTGHDGSLGTIHASGPRQALTRLEHIVALCGLELPARFARAQIASAIHLIVQLTRMRDGKRRVTSITEVVGMEGDVITTQELFSFEATGDSVTGEVAGRFVGSQLRPHFMTRAEYHGLGRALHRAIFSPETLTDADALPTIG
jgi:pilus assembly protein CpaF